MRDVETGSEWSHILGAAMTGPLEGTELQTFPSVITTWKAWRTEHPHTTVMTFSRTAQEFTPLVYEHQQDFVVGLRHRDEVVCYPLEEIIAQPVINDTVGGERVVVVYDRQGSGVMIFRCELDDQTLEFSSDDEGVLIGGDSRFSAATGFGLSGPLKGKRLKPLPAIISFTAAWKNFHPDGRVYSRASPWQSGGR